MKRCKDEDRKTIADLQVDEPTVEWRDVFRGSRIDHRFYPHHYARILVAKGTRQGWSDV
jgi:hypothetical protein